MLTLIRLTIFTLSLVLIGHVIWGFSTIAKADDMDCFLMEVSIHEAREARKAKDMKAYKKAKEQIKNRSKHCK